MGPIRSGLLVLCLILAACSSAAEPGTLPTTAEQPATTRAPSATTTTPLPSSTTTEPACTEVEAVFFDSRGFVCPPHMKPGRFFSDAIGYRPGTYTTRLFEPGFSFTQQAAFQSGGENLDLVAIEENSSRAMYMFSAGPAGQLAAFPFDTLPWVQDLEVSPIEYWGASGTQIDFTVGSCPAVGCLINVDAFIEAYGWVDGSRVRLLIIDVAGGPIAVEITSQKSRFEAFWSEVAQPILESIEFAGD